MKTTFLRLVKLVLPFKWWMLLAALIGFFTVGSSVGLLMTSAYIIAKAALHPSIAELQVAIVGVRFFGIARGLFRYIERLISHKVTFRLLAKFRVWFYEAIEPLAPARMMRFKSGDLLSRLVSDIESLQNFYIRVLAPPITAVMVSLLMWLLFGMFSWHLSLILFLFMAAAGFGVPVLTLFAFRRHDNKLLQLQGEMSSLTVELIQGLPDLLVYGGAEKKRRQLQLCSEELLALKQKTSNINALHEYLIGLLMNGAVFAILFYAIPIVSIGSLNAVYLSVLALGTMAAFEAMMPLPEAALHLQDNLRAAERLFEIIDTTSPISSTASSASKPKTYDIEFKSVYFAYEKEKFVLENFSLCVGQGARLIITGQSGVGKTTIANLLRQFWDVQSGQILIDGMNIRQFSQHSLSEIIGYVPQHAHLFNGTIRDNLLLGKPDATDEEMYEACQQAQIIDFLNSHAGLDTWIGEQGILLSGGERQRVALARALIKETPIFIFDEPLARLDPINANLIFESIKQIQPRKTIIVISHLPLSSKGWTSLNLPSN
jgi:ATP-binding cassette, subfamily C, bacterial CydC